MAPISTGELESTYELWSHPQCSGSTRDVGSLVGAGTHLPCGYMEQFRVCLKVLCNSQEWHPSPFGELESIYELWSHPQCSGSARDVGSLVGAGTHQPCGYMEQFRVCIKVLCNSQEWHPSPLVSLKVHMSCGHTPSVPDPRVTLGSWLAQVHTYPVGTWNSSESASKCFATHKNGTHLNW